MKKRILCLIIAVVMVLPMVLASCSDTRSDEEIIQGILGGENAVTALTLSIWLPTDADLSTPESKKAFEDRLSAVENRINEILIEKNYSTKIDFIAIPDAEYDAKLEEKFASMEGKKGDAYRKGQGYKNEIDYYYPDPNDKSNFIYQIKYPDVLSDSQLDIFLLRGYDTFIKHVENDDLEALDKYISANGSVYSNINKLIRPNILAQMKVNKKTYAIPNNHQYAQDKYQFVLINKALFDSYNLDIQNITSVVDTEEFIKLVAEDSDNTYVPFVGSLDDAPGVFMYDNDMFVGSVANGGVPTNIYEQKAYTDYVAFIKRISEMSQLLNVDVNSDVAVQFMYGATTDIENFEKNIYDNGSTVYSGTINGKEYYILKSETPVAELDDVYSSMFAISKYSINPDRAMKVLYLLQSNEEIRTLLQYGIENEDYKLEIDNETFEEKIILTDSAYKMNILYTGNGYYTFPENGSYIADWQYVKDLNFDMVINPLAGLDYYMNSDKITAEEKETLASNKALALAVIQAYNVALSNMSSAQFDAFLAIDFDIVYENIASYNEQIESINEAIAEVNAEIARINNNAELSAEEKEEYLAEASASIEKLNEKLTKVNENLAKEMKIIEPYQFVTDLRNSKAYQDVLAFYAKLYSLKNK